MLLLWAGDFVRSISEKVCQYWIDLFPFCKVNLGYLASGLVPAEQGFLVHAKHGDRRNPGQD